MATDSLPLRRPPTQLLLSYTLLLLAVVVLLQLASIYPSATCHFHSHHSSTTRMLVDEEKTRLGSRPPSCHNSCNSCHPCMPVQVPPLPSHIRVESTPLSSGELDSTNQLSDYKPLEWKCHCKGHVYNP